MINNEILTLKSKTVRFDEFKILKKLK